MAKYEEKLTIIIALMVAIIIIEGILIYGMCVNHDNIVRLLPDNNEWDEASIIVEGEEIVRGQIDYYYTNNNNETTLYFSDGNVWTTNVNNVIIQHHNTR